MNGNMRIVVSNASCGHFSKKLERMICSEAEKSKMLKWNKADLKKTIDNEDSILVLANKEIVGFTCLILYQKNVEICALIVASEHRRRGIGTVLMGKAVNLAKEKYSNKGIILFPNKISSHIGEKFGFVVIDKNILDDEVWEKCTFCLERKNFPNCRCRPMMLKK